MYGVVWITLPRRTVYSFWLELCIDIDCWQFKLTAQNFQACNSCGAGPLKALSPVTYMRLLPSLLDSTGRLCPWFKPAIDQVFTNEKYGVLFHFYNLICGIKLLKCSVINSRSAQLSCLVMQGRGIQQEIAVQARMCKTSLETAAFGTAGPELHI